MPEFINSVAAAEEVDFIGDGGVPTAPPLFVESDETRDGRLRRLAITLGHRVTKSRVREVHMNDHGGYMLCDDRNIVIEGDHHELTLDRLEEVLLRIKERK